MIKAKRKVRNVIVIELPAGRSRNWDSIPGRGSNIIVIKTFEQSVGSTQKLFFCGYRVIGRWCKAVGA